MKRKILLSLFCLVLALSALCFSACIVPNAYQVLFIADGKVHATVKTYGGEQLIMPEEPTKENHIFGGWYFDEQFEQEFTADSLLQITLGEDLSVHARFIPYTVDDHAHVFNDQVIAPTCLQKGYTIHTCACGFTYNTDLVNALGHLEALQNEVSPTCETGGFSGGKYCSRCGFMLEAQTFVKALGHEFTNYVANNDQTTEKDGTKTATCNREGCNERHTLVIENSKLPVIETPNEITVIFLNGEIEVSKVDTIVGGALSIPTPSKDGEVFDGWYLDNGFWQIPFTANYINNEELEGEIKVYAKFNSIHTHSYQSALTAPSCETIGYTTYSCACGHTYKDNFVNALGHDELISPKTNATCTTNGKTEGITCKRCNKVLKVSLTIEATGHVKQTTPAVESTCTTDGKTEHVVCSVCHAILVSSQVVEATGHTYTVDTIAPTCTQDGYTIKACSCGHYEITKQTALGHNFGEYSSNNDATLDADGTKTATCQKGCGATDTVVDEGTKLVHVHEYVNSVFPSTCLEQGYTTHKCYCGHTFTDSYTVALGHNFLEEDYLDNNDGTLTCVCSRPGCYEENTKNDTRPVIFSSLAYLEDFGKEQIVDAEKVGESTDSAGKVSYTYSPVFTTITPRIFFSHLSFPAGNYTATLNGTSIGSVVVDSKGEITISSLPSGLTLGNKYTFVCTTSLGKPYTQTIKFVSRAIDTPDEFLRAITYYNQHAKACSNKVATNLECGKTVSTNLSKPNSSYVNTAQYYNGSSFTQRYYVLATDIGLDHDDVHYGVGGGGFTTGYNNSLENPYCDLFHQKFSTWFDIFDGQGYTIDVADYVDGGLFGHIESNAKVFDVAFTPTSSWWNKTAVASKAGLAMSISKNATVDNVCIIFNFTHEVSGLSAIACTIESGASLSNIYVCLPESFKVDPSLETYATATEAEHQTGFIGYDADLTDSTYTNIVVVSAYVKVATWKVSGLFTKTYTPYGASNQEYENYFSGIYLFDSAEDCVREGSSRVGNWIIQDSGYATYTPYL